MLGTWRGRILGSAVLVACLAWTSAARAGDAALAEFLLKAGREALEKGDFDDAYSKFLKSHEESRNVFEVQYWLGVVCEKREDLPLAVGYYRLFLRNVDLATRASVLPGSYPPLAKKARARLDVLAAATGERSKLDEALATKLVAMARKQLTANPEVARRATLWAWRLVGESPAVVALLADLSLDPRADEPKPDNDPELEQLAEQEPRKAFADLPELTQGKSMLYERVFGVHKHWSWSKDVVIIDCPEQGQLAWPVVEQTVGGRLMLELEVRTHAEYDAKWGVGPAFGTRDDFLAIFMSNNQVVVCRVTTAGGFQDITGIGLPPFDPRAWHRLSVRVDGAKLTVWLDGKQVIDHTLSKPLPATTGGGLWYQRSKIEVRTLRFGRLP